jgi:hypothetical protein
VRWKRRSKAKVSYMRRPAPLNSGQQRNNHAWRRVGLTSVRSAASGFMLAAAVRRAGCRREAGISDGRPATGVTPHWYGSAEVLQHRADAKPLVSCSEKLGRTCMSYGRCATRRAISSTSRRARSGYFVRFMCSAASHDSAYV